MVQYLRAEYPDVFENTDGADKKTDEEQDELDADVMVEESSEEISGDKAQDDKILSFYLTTLLEAIANSNASLV